MTDSEVIFYQFYVFELKGKEALKLLTTPHLTEALDAVQTHQHDPFKQGIIQAEILRPQQGCLQKYFRNFKDSTTNRRQGT